MTLHSFRKAIKKTPIDLLDSALIIAESLAYPDLDKTAIKQQIAAIAAQIKTNQLLEGRRSRDHAEALAQYLYNEIGLRGNTQAYEDERNSYVNDVLERGLGIPITLSIIYISIAQQLGMKAHGVGLPGHFIVRVDNQIDQTYIDPFNGTRLSARECAQMVRQSTGFEGTFRPEWLNPADPQSIIVRILNNLRYVYLQSGQWDRVTTVITHLRVLAPDDPTYLRDDAVVLFNNEDYYGATKILEHYLEVATDESDAAMIQITLGQMLSQWVRLN